jgi:hypothetical protein
MREMIDHRHPPQVGGRRDVIHGHLIEAPFKEEARGRVGDGLLARGSFSVYAAVFPPPIPLVKEHHR